MFPNIKDNNLFYIFLRSSLDGALGCMLAGVHLIKIMCICVLRHVNIFLLEKLEETVFRKKDLTCRVPAAKGIYMH